MDMHEIETGKPGNKTANAESGAADDSVAAHESHYEDLLLENVVDTLFTYLRNVIYDPANAELNLDELPESFHEFGKGLHFFSQCVIQTMTLAKSLSRGELDDEIPPSYNEIAAPLKSLHASLRHMTWQAQQIAKGDYKQRIGFMGDFSKSFNTMAQQLDERNKQEIQIRSKLQTHINLILSTTPSILLSFDTDEKAVFASDSFIKRNNIFSAEDIEGKSFSELFLPISSVDFVQKMEGLIMRVTDTKNSITIEDQLDIGQDGNVRTYLIFITPSLYEGETFFGIMVIFDDITEIVRARELAEQSMRAKSDFLARMSHEMRTPMNAIIGMASIGKSTTSSSKKDNSFEMIENASTHLLEIVNDLLDMSSIDAGKFELISEEFCFNSMINQVISIIGVLAAEKKQIFKIDVNDEVPLRIISDEQRLKQVIINLLSNAVKFTPENGSIELSVRKKAQTNTSYVISFTVRDTGIGISAHQQERLFFPFEQVDVSYSRKFGGTGLGLTISKNIVEKMGGSILVESELGKGASFSFDIVAGIAAEEKHVSIKSEYTAPIDGIFTGMQLLVVEDVEINREIISALLEETGIEISFAVNGAEAVDMYSSNPELYDVILMDIQMPVIDGYEATRLIRSSGLAGAKDIPIIAMTAHVFQEDVRHCISAGMNDHLGKPIDIDTVIEKLGKYAKAD